MGPVLKSIWKQQPRKAFYTDDGPSILLRDLSAPGKTIKPLSNPSKNSAPYGGECGHLTGEEFQDEMYVVSLGSQGLKYTKTLKDIHCPDQDLCKTTTVILEASYPTIY